MPRGKEGHPPLPHPRLPQGAGTAEAAPRTFPVWEEPPERRKPWFLSWRGEAGALRGLPVPSPGAGPGQGCQGSSSFYPTSRQQREGLSFKSQIINACTGSPSSLWKSQGETRAEPVFRPRAPSTAAPAALGLGQLGLCPLRAGCGPTPAAALGPRAPALSSGQRQRVLGGDGMGAALHGGDIRGSSCRLGAAGRMRDSGSWTLGRRLAFLRC